MSQGDDAERNGTNQHGPPALDPLRLDPLQDEALRWFLELQAATDKATVGRALDAWLAQDERHAAAFAEVSRLWNSAEFSRALARHERAPARHDRRADMTTPDMATPDMATLTAQRLQLATPRSWSRRVAALAAVLVLAVAAAHFSGLLVYLKADYVTVTGQQRRVALPDGSTMLLNSGSAVVLDFSAERRAVRLIEGEAFFDVVRNPELPFQVTGRFADVEVTGTAFAVRAAGERDSVTLQHGSVSVVPRSSSAKTVKLTPRHTVAVGAAGTGTIDPVDPEAAFAWLEGRIRFRDRPLGTVLDELRRYHRGIIIVTDSRITDIRVSGNYRIDDPALVVASLAEAVGARLTRLSDHILILR